MDGLERVCDRIGELLADSVAELQDQAAILSADLDACKRRLHARGAAAALPPIDIATWAALTTKTRTLQDLFMYANDLLARQRAEEEEMPALRIVSGVAKGA